MLLTPTLLCACAQPPAASASDAAAAAWANPDNFRDCYYDETEEQYQKARTAAHQAILKQVAVDQEFRARKDAAARRVLQEQIAQLDAVAVAGAAEHAAAAAHIGLAAVGEHDVELAKVRALAVPMKNIRDLIEQLRDLSVETTPNFSQRVDKDRPQVEWTQDGLTARTKSLDKQVGNLNAERIILLRAITKYMGYFNNCCDAKYRVTRYKKELRALEVLRKHEQRARVENAVINMEHKVANVKGFKDRQEKKEDIKRKQPTSNDAAKPSVFDLV